VLNLGYYMSTWKTNMSDSLKKILTPYFLAYNSEGSMIGIRLFAILLPIFLMFLFFYFKKSSKIKVTNNP